MLASTFSYFFYRGLLKSVLSFNIITWYGNGSAKNKIKLARVVKLIDEEQKHLSSRYNAALKRKARQTLYDPTHPLKDAFQKLPSRTRIKDPQGKKNLFNKSFIPSAILILNAKF